MIEALRIIGGGLIALVSSYIGLLIKRRYKSRETFYKSALEYAMFLESELKLTKSAIPTVADKFCASHDGDFKGVLSKFAESYRGKGKAECSLQYLKKPERQEIDGFLGGEGKSTLQEQLSVIAYYKNKFGDKCKACEDESKRLGGMYFKLFVLLGVVIMLILA